MAERSAHRTTGLTATEQEVILDVGKLWDRIVNDIILDGPSRAEDCKELMVHIHGIQRMIGAQAAARDHPDLFRLLGDKGVADTQDGVE